MMKPELRGLDPSSNIAVAEMLVFDLDREGRLVDADRWFLALDFLRLAGMVDAAPANQSLGRAYRAVGDVLRGDAHNDWERDPEVKAQIDRLRREP
jgi:hypothetical protein